MRMRRGAGRYVYILKIHRGFEDGDNITVYGTFKRANEALHKRMMELISKGNFTEEEITQTRKRFIKNGWYSLEDEDGIIEDGCVDIHKVF